MDTKGLGVFRFSLPSRKYAAGRVVGENSFFDFCAGFGELGNLWLWQGCCCSMPWRFGCLSFPANFPAVGEFPGVFPEIREIGCG